MSFRAIWIIAKNNNQHGRVLLSRKYPTVERRSKVIHGTRQNCVLPNDENLVECLFTKLGISRKTHEFTEDQDGCQLNEKPVFEIVINQHKLWPFVVVEKFNVVIACLGLVEREEYDSNTPLTEIPVIAIGYALLHNIVEYLEPACTNISELTSQVDEVDSLLKILMPFGTPTDTNLNTARQFWSGKDIGWVPKYKLSAWRPIVHKTKSHIHLSVQEKISAAIYNHPERNVYKDTCHIHGAISCKAEVEGVPEVSLNVKSQGKIRMVFHPCLQSHDIVTATSQTGLQTEYYSESTQGPLSRNVSFIPPLEQFPLAHYNGESRLPVHGVYQMITETEVTKIQVQLQLSDGIKNSFEFFEVHIPFFHSGVITKLDYDNNYGTVLVSPEKRRLAWSIGQKFPKTLKVVLNATVLLGEPSNVADKTNFKDDPFCQGLNSYIQVHFKMPNVTMSGVDIDSKSVHINPAPGSKPKVNVGKELATGDYKLWNIHGDAMVAFPPTL